MINVSAIREKFNALGIELQLFFILILVSDKNGYIKIKKEDVAKYLKITKQTVSKYLRTFASAKILKYKYSGIGIFNPAFYYVGASAELQEAMQRYNEFKSDI